MNRRSLTSLLETRAIIFGTALVNFMVRWVYINKLEAELQLMRMTAGNHWYPEDGYPVLELAIPFLLLAAAILLLVPSWWSQSITLFVSGFVIHEAGFRPLSAVSNAFDIPMLSGEAVFRLWNGVCGPFSRLLFSVSLGGIVFCYAGFVLSRSIISRSLTPGPEKT